MAERDRALGSLHLPFKALISWWGPQPHDLMTSSKPNYTPQWPCLQIPSPWRLSLQHMSLGDTNIQFITVTLYNKIVEKTATLERRVYLVNIDCQPTSADGGKLAVIRLRRKDTEMNMMLSPRPRQSCSCFHHFENPLVKICCNIKAFVRPMLKCSYRRERFLVQA